MHRHLVATIALAAQPLLIVAAAAQTAAPQPAQSASARATATVPAAADGYPADIKVRKGETGFEYVDAHGTPLFAVDSRFLRFAFPGTGGAAGGQGQRAQGQGQGAAQGQGARQGGFGGQGGGSPPLCTGACAQGWVPLAAPADAQPMGKWKVMKGAEGPQWTFGGDFVFTPAEVKKTGKSASSVGGAFDVGYDELWRKLAYVPAAPKVAAPAGVKPVYAEEVFGYILADSKGHALYTPKAGAMCKACTGWAPFSAGAVAQNLGDWSIARDGDRPQWFYRGKPVFISQEDKPTAVPAAGIALRP